MANIIFNGTDLSPYLNTPGVSGVHDLAGREVEKLYLPGQDVPVEMVKRLTTRPLSFNVVVGGEDHSDLVANLRTLKGLLSPSLGYKPLSIVDRPDQQVMARCNGFPIDINVIPYLHRAVEFTLTFDRYPYWEDHTSVKEDPVGGSITNDGDVVCYPLWTCTVTGTLADGLWFQVGDQRFTIDAALVATDVVTVDADPQAPTPKVNGGLAWANTATDAAFPALAVGANAITKSSTDVTIKAEYRRRYE